MAFIHCMAPSGAIVVDLQSQIGGRALNDAKSFQNVGSAFLRRPFAGRNPTNLALAYYYNGSSSPAPSKEQIERQCHIKRCQPKSLRALRFCDGIILKAMLAGAKKHRKSGTNRSPQNRKSWSIWEIGNEGPRNSAR